MSKVQAIESELQKLSANEMRQVRDWLDQLLKKADGSAATADSAVTELREQVNAGVRQVHAGKVVRFDDAVLTRIKARGRKLLRGE